MATDNSTGWSADSLARQNADTIFMRLVGVGDVPTGLHAGQEAFRVEAANLEDPLREVGCEWRAPWDRNLEYGD